MPGSQFEGATLSGIGGIPLQGDRSPEARAITIPAKGGNTEAGRTYVYPGDSNMNSLPSGPEKTAVTVRSVSVGRVQLRDVDVTVAEAELRLRLPEATAALEAIDNARVVSQETLEFKFSI